MSITEMEKISSFHFVALVASPGRLLVISMITILSLEVAGKFLASLFVFLITGFYNLVFFLVGDLQDVSFSCYTFSFWY